MAALPNRKMPYQEDFNMSISGRGAGSGSYMSEASILEIFSWVKTHFHIDKCCVMNHSLLLGLDVGKKNFRCIV